MAYDEGLAERISDVVTGRRGVTAKKMFGGVAWLLDGKMFVGVVKDDLMVRCGPDNQAAALKQPHVRVMDFTGSPMKGYVYVAPAGLESDKALRSWVDLAAAHVATLPDKPPKKVRKKA